MLSLRPRRAFALVIALAIGATPALSSQTIVGQVVKQSAPATIESCSIDLEGDAFLPHVDARPRDVHTAVVEAYDLEFTGASLQSLGRVRVTAPFVRVAGPPPGTTGLRCSIAELKFDDGQVWSSARTRDPQSFNNAAIGVVLLAGIAILASRHYTNGPAPAATDTGLATPTATPSATPTATASATATATASAAPAPTATATAVPVTRVEATRRPETIRRPPAPGR